jgi:hypothetical protein
MNCDDMAQQPQESGPDPSILLGKMQPNYKEGQIKKSWLPSVVEHHDYAGDLWGDARNKDLARQKIQGMFADIKSRGGLGSLFHPSVGGPVHSGSGNAGPKGQLGKDWGYL